MERYPTDSITERYHLSLDTKEFQGCSVARTSVRLYPIRTKVRATLISAANLSGNYHRTVFVSTL